MTEAEPATIQSDPLPVPYSVIAVGWVVLLIVWHKVAHQLPFYLWFVGPVLIILKVYLDAERIGKKKDDPPPVTYRFHAAGVWAALDETIKTLPGFFKDLHVQTNYQNPEPPKGQPLQLEVTITMRHSDVKKNQLPANKQGDMKSTLWMKALITPIGNQAQLKLQYKCVPLLSRQPLDEVIAHIQKQVTTLVEQHVKQ